MKKLVSIAFLVGLISPSFSQQTTGLFQNDAEAEDGFVLWTSLLNGHSQYLMNTCGEVVHSWSSPSTTPANSMYLMADGTLIYPAKADTASNNPINGGGGGERILQVDWDGNVLWDYIYYDNTKRLHHDIAVMPNGNVLAIAWVLVDSASCVAVGRDPELISQGALWFERIIEVEKTGPTTGNIVWQWDLIDHIVQEFDPQMPNFGVVADHPELLDVNWTNSYLTNPATNDFVHLNSIDYNEELDQIILSSQVHSEVWIIDHSTTTAEAASHSGGAYGKGGDFLYRWGNPQVYGRGTGSDQVLWRQHNANWIPAGYEGEGGIMIFNNGLDRTPGFSEVDVIEPVQTSPGVYELNIGQAYGPIEKAWNYHAPDSISFYSYFISGATRLPNGNTLVCSGERGHIFEVTMDGEVVWSYVSPVQQFSVLGSTDPVQLTPNGAFHSNAVFRAEKYLLDFPAFVGRDLSTGVHLESDPFIACLVGVDDMNSEETISIYPNPSSGHVTVENMNGASLNVFDHSGRMIISTTMNSDRYNFDLSDRPAGIYALRFELNGKQLVEKLIVN